MLQGSFFFNLAVFVVGCLAAQQRGSEAQTNGLKTATTQVERMKLLPSNEDWFFDFTKQNKYVWSPGGVINADASTFPATIGQGMTLAVLNLGPCSFLPPHLHPRATNYVVAINGTTQTIMMAQNDVQTIVQNLTTNQMTIFPRGSIHTMFNYGCEPAQLISALNSEDPGTLNIANSFWSLPSNFTDAVVGTGWDMAGMRARIPKVGTGAISGTEACKKTCEAKGYHVRRGNIEHFEHGMPTGHIGWFHGKEGPVHS